MADCVGDLPAPIAPDAQQARQHQPPPGQGPKRNSRNRKNNQHSQRDGAMSDGALVHSAASPRPRKSKHGQSGTAASGQPQHDQMGQGNGQRARPVSYAGGRVAQTPAKEQAYAGPTFQSSPAASALPMPNFSKSVPNAAVRGSLSARLAAEKRLNGEQSSPEADPVVPTPPPREAMTSPLDLFFNADREEKARSASQTLSPQMPHRRQQQPTTEPRNLFAQRERNIFLHELDGDADVPSPRTVPTDHNRPHPTPRTVSSPGAAHRAVSSSEEERRASTQNLKEMLFSAAVRPANQATGQSPMISGPTTPSGYFHSPSPFNRPDPGSSSRAKSSPTTPQPACESQQQDNYSLHYGNRNLSPLFKASRTETPPRPSSLRQEVASVTSSNADSGVATGDPHRLNTFARNYLDQTARTARSAEMPSLPLSNRPGALQRYSAGASAPTSEGHIPIPQQTATTNGSAPRGNELRDMSAESAELRRMLKIF